MSAESGPARTSTDDEIASLFERHWAERPAGPSQPLKTAWSICFRARTPAMLLWGPELVQFYNAACATLVGGRHPGAFGSRVAEAFPERWDLLGPVLRDVLHDGRTVLREDRLLLLESPSGPVTSSFRFSFSPVYGADDGIEGVFCAVEDATRVTRAERRLEQLEHAFATPLTLVLGPLDDLARSVVDVDDRAAVELARRNALQLQRLVATLLDAPSLANEADIAPCEEGTAPGPALSRVVAAAPAGALRVLVADDNGDLRAYLTTLLAPRYAVDTVSDGAALVAAARSTRPDVIVTDVTMPHLDGFEAVRLLRDDPRTQHIPILLLSARAGEEAAAAGLAAGADDYVVKPFTSAELLARVDALARRRTAFLEPSLEASRVEVQGWRLLAAAAERFIGIASAKRVLDALGDILVPALADWYTIYLRDDAEIRLTSVVHRQPAKRDFAWMVDREYPERVGDGGTLDHVIATGRSVFNPNLAADAGLRSARDARHAAILTALRLRSSAIVPFEIDGRAGGAVVVMTEGNRRLREADIELLERLVRRASAAYHAAAIAERQRTVASALQRALLPGALPAAEGLSFSVAYTPAAHEAQVGGDWYDAFPLTDGRILLSIGDVVGHGLGAAVAMSSLRQAIRGFAIEDPQPSAILAHLNRLLIHEGRGELATALVAVLEPFSLDVTLASAGHFGPILVDAQGEIETIEVAGCMLGVNEGEVYEDTAFALGPGASMVLYTDGLVENERDAIAGGERLRAVLPDCAASGDDLAGAVYRKLLGDALPADDVAVLTVTASRTLERLDITLPAEPRYAARARTAIARFLNGAGLTDRVDDLLVAAGEALANAIEHAYPGGRGDVRIRGRANSDVVTLEIRDFGAWRDDALNEGRGFGVPLMRAFADAVDVERTPFGTRVEIAARRTAVVRPRDIAV